MLGDIQMSNTSKALAWATVMIVAAIVMQAQGLNDNASMAVIAGLTGAAWGSLNVDRPCSKGCLQ